MYKRYLLWGLLPLVFFPWWAFAQSLPACTHWASPSGSGSVCTDPGAGGTPCLIMTFLNNTSTLAVPGNTLCLLDGTYTGANSRITISASVNGTAGNLITVRAINPGSVTLDGQGGRPYNTLGSYTRTHGINFKNGDNVTAGVRGHHNILQEVIAYNTGNTNESNIDVGGTDNLVEDFGIFGGAEKSLKAGTTTTGPTRNIARRGFIQWEKSNSANPTNACELGYGQDEITFENLICNWHRVGTDDGQPQGVFQFFRSEDSKWLGSIGYVKSADSVQWNKIVQGTTDGGSGFAGGDFHPLTNMLFKHNVLWIDPANAAYSTVRALSLIKGNASGLDGSGNLVQDVVAISNLAPDIQTPIWTATNVISGTTLSAALGSATIWDTIPGVCSRYVNGTLTSEPLWPWPMDQRIIDAMTAEGYTGTAIVDVTATMASLFGTIPGGCVEGGEAISFLNNPTSVSISAPSTITFLGNPTSVSVSAAGGGGGGSGNIINAASCSAADVQSAINSAASGDTVQIPAGTCNWTTGVSWTAPANTSLLGAGSLTTVGGGDATIIQDNIAVDDPILSINVASTGAFRLAGITFRSGTGAIKDSGSLTFSGPGKLRIDHIHWQATSSANYQVLLIGGDVFGVLDHSILELSGTNAIYLRNSRGGTGDTPHKQGNFEWSLPTGFGTEHFFFIEDNEIIGDSSTTRIWDIFTAGRAIARFNTLTSSTMGETHGTGHAGDDRGARAQEVYGNIGQLAVGQTNPNFCLVEIQTGGGLFWGNSAPEVYKNVFRFNVTRKNNDSYGQTVPPGGWGYCGTAFTGTGSNWDQNTDASTGYACLDMPGRGPGDILTGAFPTKTNQRTGTVAWPQQALEGLYIWANDASIAPGWGGSFYSNNTLGRMVADRDYYAQSSGIQISATSPFNGTSGTGWGTIANRPTTCTAGVGYWATNEGSWNTSTSNPYGVQQNGADGNLYKCTATNTWTLYYTPYTYPHPLQSTTGGAPPLSNPSSVSITANSTATFLNNPGSVSMTADGTITFLSNPLSVSITLP